MPDPILVYGATGYTGQLIVALARRQGLAPVLAGRNAEAVGALAAQHGLTHRVAALDDAPALDRALDGMNVVIHCAGPFVHTSRAMVDACLRTGVHYLDITGEWQVFEACATRDAEARARGVMLLPGVGFDVVPSDCLAAHVVRRLPDATSLALAFRALGGPSRGTALTMAESLGRPGVARIDGRLVAEPMGAQVRRIDFGDGTGPQTAASIAWGDVSTAYHSTGVPNVRVYMSMTPAMLRQLRLARWLGPVLRSGTVQRALRQRIVSGRAGPSSESRARRDSRLWAEARNAAGRVVVSTLRGPNGYDLTADAAVRIAQRVLAGSALPGFQTPSKAYGADFVLELPGVTRAD
nr:saccharopine dehydrogenase NADP-binding domain-containing protein [Gemmatimonadaceae bacterium]